jgi:hypothetical protein
MNDSRQPSTGNDSATRNGCWLRRRLGPRGPRRSQKPEPVARDKRPGRLASAATAQPINAPTGVPNSSGQNPHVGRHPDLQLLGRLR